MIRFNFRGQPVDASGNLLAANFTITISGAPQIIVTRETGLFPDEASSIQARPLNNVQFWPRSRKAKISTAGIYGIFRGLKFEPDKEIGQKGILFKGLQASGFTLIELVITIALAGIVMMMITPFFQSGIINKPEPSQRPSGSRMRWPFNGSWKT